MRIPLYQIDAFSSRLFGGNPAAVCLLDEWLDDATLQAIAAENNLSETAYIVSLTSEQFELRWFTPTVEVQLCGHATLAGAHVLLRILNSSRTKVRFTTASGELTVSRDNELLSMDFPARKGVATPVLPQVTECLGKRPRELYQADDYLMAVYDSEDDIINLAPDLDRMLGLEDAHAIIVTAPGTTSDLVSRFFAPRLGVPEDPVTGSAHCTLAPYWSERLGKTKLHARQLSRRGGELFCEDKQDRIQLSGHAVLYSRGEIII